MDFKHVRHYNDFKVAFSLLREKMNQDQRKGVIGIDAKKCFEAGLTLSFVKNQDVRNSLVEPPAGVDRPEREFAMIIIEEILFKISNLPDQTSQLKCQTFRQIWFLTLWVMHWELGETLYKGIAERLCDDKTSIKWDVRGFTKWSKYKQLLTLAVYSLRLAEERYALLDSIGAGVGDLFNKENCITHATAYLKIYNFIWKNSERLSALFKEVPSKSSTCCSF